MMLFMSLRVGGWLLALAMVTVWWFVSLADPPTARERSQELPASPVAGDRTTSAFTERLKHGLANRPGQPRPRRNPFAFASREPAPAPVNAAPPIAPPPPPAPPTTPPAFTLAGIGASTTPDGVERTAVLSTGKGVLLAKAGDDLPNGTRVVRVEDDHIVIADAAGNETILRLK